MKKQLTAAVVLLLVLVLSASAAFALTNVTKYVNTNGGHLNVRESAGYDGEIIGRLSYRERVTQISSYGGWSEILYGDDQSGWVRSSYLSTYRPDPIAPTARPVRPTPEPYTPSASLDQYFIGFHQVSYSAVVVNTTGSASSYVNLRWGPAKSFPIRSVKLEGTSVRIISTNGTWSQVIDDNSGDAGFMMNRYLNTGAVGSGTEDASGDEG